MKTHNPTAYQIVIYARYLLESATDLYHAASRDESTSYQIERLQSELNEVGKAFDNFNATKGQ